MGKYKVLTSERIGETQAYFTDTLREALDIVKDLSCPCAIKLPSGEFYNWPVKQVIQGGKQ